MDTYNRILTYLKENRTATITNLTMLWGLTRADIRHHINNLLQDGLIEKVSPVKQKQIKRGRPEHEYSLCSKSGDGNYHNLCAVLLKFLLRCYPTNIQGDLLETLAKEISANPIQTSSLTKKMNILVSWLNERGYHSHWEAGAEGPRLMFLHCPYAILLPEYPELCRLDELILENSLSLKIKQIAQMDPRSNNSRACVFKIL